MCRSTGSPDALPSTTSSGASPGRSDRRDGDAGFTLLEVLVAFAVLAVMLVPILQVFGGGLGIAQTARGYAEAAMLARSKLAEVVATGKLREGESSGDFGPRGYRWRASVITDHSDVTLPDNTVVSPATARAGSTQRRRSSDGGGASSNTGAITRSGGSLFGQNRSGSGSSSGSGGSLFGQSRSGSGSSSGSSGSLFGQSRSGFGSSSGSGGSAATGSSRSGSAFGTQTGASPGAAGQDEQAGLGDGAASIPYRVSVTVEWGDPYSSSGAVTLTTLRLVPDSAQPGATAE
ncbi:MAG TPA: prepilin-type N-terminal cleavage/methylation domain-containing protein [Rhodospirillales bacterium]|nr:prepilin-type N-terminal cleavage/methylation domain-containing protein [Rhodospirillales bacterium]